MIAADRPDCLTSALRAIRAVHAGNEISPKPPLGVFELNVLLGLVSGRTF
ncbi:hypothetical protein CEV32_3538 [Brucella rhizosphaerae]|uniref:Uncharacterized protein n=1 Tax=Brucella rhizosphaerae TaxID=571254 RepID=A0A256FTG6_9HYPH|nr:hypothetical protein CEV32_3538 [Brucella rhizosphaerae]